MLSTPEPSLTIAGQTLRLLPERCAYWEEAGMLLLADLHLGKAAHFRHHGMAVPEGHTADDLARLTRAIQNTQAKEVLFCGDFFHAPAAQSASVLDLVEQWRASHPDVSVRLITGNHDRGKAMPPNRCGIEPAGPHLVRGPLHFRHDPAEACGQHPTITGHLHPLAALGPAGSRALRAPCFWWQTSRLCLVLPAFSTFTAGVAIRPEESDSLHVIHSEKVTAVPTGFCNPLKPVILRAPLTVPTSPPPPLPVRGAELHPPSPWAARRPRRR